MRACVRFTVLDQNMCLRAAEIRAFPTLDRLYRQTDKKGTLSGGPSTRSRPSTDQDPSTSRRRCGWQTPCVLAINGAAPNGLARFRNGHFAERRVAVRRCNADRTWAAGRKDRQIGRQVLGRREELTCPIRRVHRIRESSGGRGRPGGQTGAKRRADQQGEARWLAGPEADSRSSCAA